VVENSPGWSEHLHRAVPRSILLLSILLLVFPLKAGVCVQPVSKPRTYSTDVSDEEWKLFAPPFSSFTVTLHASRDLVYTLQKKSLWIFAAYLRHFLLLTHISPFASGRRVWLFPNFDTGGEVKNSILGRLLKAGKENQRLAHIEQERQQFQSQNASQSNQAYLIWGRASVLAQFGTVVLMNDFPPHCFSVALPLMSSRMTTRKLQ
jgi:hypothetical protein